MQNLDILLESLEYIELHLKDTLKTDVIAEAVCCSRSTLEKLFMNINAISVQDYIKRRRMTLAARQIYEKKEGNILALALQYGYTTNESFTRAFKDVWNCTPSEYRDRKYSELFPRYLGAPINRYQGETVMSKKYVDISELYDLFKSRMNCYFICCDIKCLMPINEISHKAGDLAILESMNRMLLASGDEDMTFRIGGDEFCTLTASTDESYAQEIAARIRQQNGNPIIYEGTEIPLTLHVVVMKGSGSCNLRYSDLYNELQTALEQSKSLT